MFWVVLVSVGVAMGAEVEVEVRAILIRASPLPAAVVFLRALGATLRVGRGAGVHQYVVQLKQEEISPQQLATLPGVVVARAREIPAHLAKKSQLAVAVVAGWRG
jgi:hypothetical protein